jgi:hypothetical protein
MNDRSSMRDENALLTWEPPADARANNAFRVRVKTVEGGWKRLFVYNVKVGHPQHGGPHDAAMVCFDFNGIVDVEVTYQGTLDHFEFRPASFGIEAQRDAETLRFTLQQNPDSPRKFVVRVNHDWGGECLHVFTNVPEPSVPDPADVDYYFAGGRTHEIGTLDVSGTRGVRLYVAGGAIVRGSIRADGAEDLRIFGRGILERGSIRSKGTARNVHLDGFIVMNASSWTVIFEGKHADPVEGPEHVRITNLAIVTHGRKDHQDCPDGIHFDAAVHCEASGCFVRCSDDLLSVDGRYVRRDMHDVRFENMVLWADRGHCMVLGYKGSPENRQTIMDVTFRNIAVINQWLARPEGVMQMFVADNLTIRDITYEDIRIMPFEDPARTSLFGIDMRMNHWSAEIPGLAVRNITFSNIDYAGAKEAPSRFIGKRPLREVSDLHFSNYTRQGRPVTGPEEGNLSVNGYVHAVTFDDTAPEHNGTGRTDFTPPLDVPAGIPFTAASFSRVPPRINFVAPSEVRAGEAYPIVDVRLINGTAVKGAIHCRNERETFTRTIPLGRTSSGLFGGSIPAEMTEEPFSYHLELERDDGVVVREPHPGATVRIVPDLEPPSPVRNLTVWKASSRGITLAWSRAQDDRRIAACEITCGTGGNQPEVVAKLPGREGFFTCADVGPGKPVRLGVTAVDGAGRRGKTRFVELSLPETPVSVPEPDVHLSEIDAVSATTGWREVRRNGNAGGEPLRVGGRTYTKGMGVHAESELVYAIKAGYERFVARVGVDDSQAPDGSVIARVLADERLLDQSPLLRGGDASWPINVAIPPEAGRLKLIVIDGGDSIAHDMTDWVDAGFLTST